MKTYLFTALLVAVSSFAQAGTLENIPRGSKVEFKGSANIRPGITGLYWQAGRMTDDYKSIQLGKFCVLSFEASGVDRALNPGIVFSVDALDSMNNHSPRIVLGRSKTSAKAELSCYEKKRPLVKADKSSTSAEEDFVGLTYLEISEFEAITGHDFKVIPSPTIDFEPVFPKPVPGDQRKFNRFGFRGSIKLNRELHLNKTDRFFHYAYFVNGQLNAAPKNLDIVCSLESAHPIRLKAGQVGSTRKDEGDGAIWFGKDAGLELTALDCYRVMIRESYSHVWNSEYGVPDRDYQYKPTVAEIQKAIGSIAKLTVFKINEER